MKFGKPLDYSMMLTAPLRESLHSFSSDLSCWQTETIHNYVELIPPGTITLGCVPKIIAGELLYNVTLWPGSARYRAANYDRL